VHYVDNHDTGALQLLYYEVSSFKFVDVEIVDDGERLTTIPDRSYDFVISNHFLEHCQDPVGALASHVRVLKPGGVLYCAVPDCRRTFDSVRERTTFEHVWLDHKEGPARSRREHYQDFSSRVNGRSGAEHEAWWRMLDALDFSIHFHVWTPWDVLELVTETRKRLALPLDLREFVAHGNECVVILEKG
jgi:predicted SAM-dependent methyltransferase